MKYKHLFSILFFLSCFWHLKGLGNNLNSLATTGDSIFLHDSLPIRTSTGNCDTLSQNSSDKVRKNKKAIAAILAFPFPFGMLGLHRIYLGTKPYMPFVYIGTLGGCFLILPFIDFCTILLSDAETFKQFENNPKVFMWSH